MKIAAYFTLSGNTKPYAYAVDDQALTNVSPGDRAVLVNKIKEDGEVSLSIGTYIGKASDVAPEQLKPVVSFIAADALLAAKVATLRLEGSAA